MNIKWKDVFNLKQALLLLLFLVFGPFHVGHAFHSQWQFAQHSKARVRLIKVEANKLYALFEMHLDRGWHTYYKIAGDLGMSTQFIANNETDLMIYWTQYERLVSEQGGMKWISNVYKDSMMLPMVFVWPRSKVEFTVRYAICNEVCIPLALSFDFAVPNILDTTKEDEDLFEKLQSLVIED